MSEKASDPKDRDIASLIPEDLIEAVDPQGDPALSPSPERIKRLALQKRAAYLYEDEGIPMKKSYFPKRVFRIALVAAIACILSVTAFAALNGLDFIRGIFGGSADSIGDAIETPLVSATANGREMTLEALVTDGYITNMVVSLTGKEPADANLFTIQPDIELRSSGYYTLGEFSNSKKTYYAIDLAGAQRFDSAEVSISLSPEIAPISLSIPIENHLGNAVADFPAGTKSGDLEYKQLQISSMGFLLIGREDHAQGGLPPVNIQLLFPDGKTEDLQVEFDEGGGTVGGGGGAIIAGDGQEAPLVTSFQGSRNPDGETVINGKFSRIIHPSQIKAVIMDGVEYPVN